MDTFFEFVVGYAAVAVPLMVVHVVALRLLRPNPKLLSHIVVAGHVAVLGYLVFRGVDALGVLRSLGYAAGAMFAVLVPMILVMVAISEARARVAREPDGKGDA